ncbi:MAG: polymer-forming cytoskeletal protein [Burkholderiales bacterium]|nr:polymer-forming cytoskeletal protein [Burkholderiales bacterium]
MHDHDEFPANGYADEAAPHASDAPADEWLAAEPRDEAAAAVPDPSDAGALAGGQVLEFEVGRALPLAPAALPLLQAHEQVAPGAVAATHPPAPSGTTIAQGMRFDGNATLSGPCSVSGEIEGHLRQAEQAFVAIVVTETGRVRGDITAQRISVMGRTEGILDAGNGEVSLHEGSHVHGMVRYGRIQVSGADLNATLERVTA